MDAMGVELAEQLGVWSGLWRRRDEFAAAAETALTSGVRRVVLSGCGDCHAAAEYGAALLGLRTRLEARALPAMELSRGAPYLLDEETLLVALSVSGRTPRVLEAVRAAERRGARTLAVTDDPDGPLAREASQVFVLGASPAETLSRTDYRDPSAAEYSGYHRAVPQTKTFGALQLALALLCLRLEPRFPSGRGTAAPEVESALGSLAMLGEEAAGSALRAAEVVCERVRSRGFVSFCGTGLGYSSARFCAYKLLELACLSGHAETEEYGHTLYLVTGPADAAVFLAQDLPSLERSREIASVVSEEIGAVPLVFSTAGASLPWEAALPAVPAEVAPLLFAHAGAHLVRHMARHWGVNTDRFRAGRDEERYVRGSTKMIRRSKILET